MISHITGPANREFDRPPGIAFTTHSRPGPNWVRLARFGFEFVGIAGVVAIIVTALWSA
jgi:hypothetical protein